MTTKDEIKNRISMALKDPILQQGFEIICKENAELKKQQFSLRNERNTFLAQNEQYEKDLIDFNENLTKAKEIIKKFSEFANNEAENDPEYPEYSQEQTDLWNELCDQAEQFLKEVDK